MRPDMQCHKPRSVFEAKMLGVPALCPGTAVLCTFCAWLLGSFETSPRRQCSWPLPKRPGVVSLLHLDVLYKLMHVCQTGNANSNSDDQVWNKKWHPKDFQWGNIGRSSLPSSSQTSWDGSFRRIRYVDSRNSSGKCNAAFTPATPACRVALTG
uniref:Uncharacterized protein n=1 Tax=Dunaliella tertiolecta TaxID=3047 RepID=A0A7S3QQZ7_DUNTE